MNVALSGAAGCTDIENDVLSYAIVTPAPLHGTAAISTAGTWTYTPTANYVGTDSFKFKASDGTKVSGDIMVSLTITNHQVDALNDSAVVTATTSTVIDVIHSTSAAGTAGKDSPGTGDTGQPLKVTAVTQGAHGGVTTNGSTVSYDPAGCVTGTDLFTYTISDGLTTDTASVIVTIARPGTNGLSVNPITDTPGTGLVSDGTISTTGGTVPLGVSWCGVTASPSTVRGYTVQESNTGGSTWPTTAILTATTATSTTRYLSVGTSYQWHAKTIDSSNRTGAYRASLTAKVGLYQESNTAITYGTTGVWNPSTTTSAAGGAERATSNKGASASITLTNVRQVAIVGPRSATRGSFEVWVDGAKVATVSEKATATVYRHLLYVRGLTSGVGVTHIVKIVAVGDGRIDLDAILSLS